MIKRAHQQDKSYWGPLNWVPLYWTWRSYYKFKRHGFRCAYRNKYIESSEIIYWQVVFRSQHHILWRENRFFEANRMNLSVFWMPKKTIVDSEKKKKMQLTWATQLGRAKQMLKLTTTQTRSQVRDNIYKNISEHTLTVIIIILPVYFQCLSTEINIEAMN